MYISAENIQNRAVRTFSAADTYAVFSCRLNIKLAAEQDIDITVWQFIVSTDAVCAVGFGEDIQRADSRKRELS